MATKWLQFEAIAKPSPHADWAFMWRRTVAWQIHNPPRRVVEDIRGGGVGSIETNFPCFIII